MRLALALALLLACDAHAARRALLIGISDYSASQLGPPRTVPPHRHWPDLGGPVNDVRAMQEVLIDVYGFRAGDIVTLTDQRATRVAILQAIHQHLVAPAAAGDTLFFYFGGHGSQVRNSASEEPDRLDESIVPADSAVGAADIRDKELRRLFNRILDRGAKLTVFLDHCHSGSGARGVPADLRARPRGVALDPRDVRDGSPAGPRPEDRGALVLSASQDFDAAWETRDHDGKLRGTFSWAWLRALRDAAENESAIETFLRAQARMRAETPYQDPVLAGNDEARLSPFLGPRTDRRNAKIVVAVERVRDDGVVVVRGGWANGLSPGSTLRASDGAQLSVTTVSGLTRSEARVRAGTAPRSGALLEVAGWAAPPARPLRVWVPRASGNVIARAKALERAARKRGLRWMRDPFAAAHHVRDGAGALEAIARLPRGSAVFVHVPASFALAVEGVRLVERADDADYLLVGRYAGGKLEYAFVRPLMSPADAPKSPLPLQTRWSDSVPVLRDLLLRLQKVHAWHALESPPAARTPYRLGIRRARDGAWVGERMNGGEHYGLALRAASPLPGRVAPRYFYVFSIDSAGESTLLFPRHGSGSVENRFPLDAHSPPASIPLGPAASFECTVPYGADTYVLLSTDEPLPNPWILAWEGVRAARVLAPAAWSIERLVIESVPPAREKSR